jgi:hypothetical protein
MPAPDGLTFGTGMIDAGLNEVPCETGVPSTKCGSSVYYADITALLSTYQMHIATSLGVTWPTP